MFAPQKQEFICAPSRKENEDRISRQLAMIEIDHRRMERDPAV